MTLEGIDIDNKLIDEVYDTIGKARKGLADGLLDLGRRCVAIGVSSGRYQNRSGALRSSIGCAVGIDGKLHGMDGFARILDGSTGVGEGKDFAKILVERSSGVSLFVVAGKEYASYVEAKGFDVLDTAELHFGKELERIVRELGFRIV